MLWNINKMGLMVSCRLIVGNIFLLANEVLSLNLLNDNKIDSRTMSKHDHFNFDKMIR